ncbi:APC family permease [Urechidicola croceus]|uniref:Amino acid permease n=1 Tax=Urechidicola croceus TaxID=1850246 RepID=A0A1D8P5P4_9FLAO|nr:APC family permease [Urechidicola croceus]AOW19912.1 amino acid permease [Urechidicola croceus]
MMKKEKGLKRSIGVLGLSANIINIIIGAGIFALPAIVAAGLGSASIFAYLFCGVLIILVMLCFAEVGSKISHPGGTYAYIEESFGKYAGFIIAILFIISMISSDAAIANALVDILGSFFPLFQIKFIKILFFLVLFLTLALINIKGIKEGILFVKIITLIKIIPLLVIVFVGFFDINIKNLYIESIPTLKDLGEISLILFFAFQGAESALSINGEVKNPQKSIPRAIFISVFIILITYILIQTVAQGVLGSSLVAYQENPLGELANQIFGPIGLTLVTIGAGISIFGALSSSLLSTPRILYSASIDKVIPISIISKVHSKYLTPYIAIAIYSFVAFLFATFGGFKQLAIISSGAILIIYLAVSLAVIKLRIKEKKNSKLETFRIPGGYTVPILSTIIILYFLSNLSKNEMIVTAIFIIVLSLIYLIINIFKKKNI